jgi:hypothetical protein
LQFAICNQSNQSQYSMPSSPSHLIPHSTFHFPDLDLVCMYMWGAGLNWLVPYLVLCTCTLIIVHCTYYILTTTGGCCWRWRLEFGGVEWSGDEYRLWSALYRQWVNFCLSPHRTSSQEGMGCYAMLLLPLPLLFVVGCCRLRASGCILGKASRIKAPDQVWFMTWGEGNKKESVRSSNLAFPSVLLTSSVWTQSQSQLWHCLTSPPK